MKMRIAHKAGKSNLPMGGFIPFPGSPGHVSALGERGVLWPISSFQLLNRQPPIFAAEFRGAELTRREVSGQQLTKGEL